jgi:hypothetical protein
LASKRYHLYVWVGGRWRERFWSDADVRRHVDSAVKERERLFKLKHSVFSDDLSAKVCADALRKLRAQCFTIVSLLNLEDISEVG